MSAHELPPLPPLPPPDEQNVNLWWYGWYTFVPGFYYPATVERLRREAYELGAALNAQQAAGLRLLLKRKQCCGDAACYNESSGVPCAAEKSESRKKGT